MNDSICPNQIPSQNNQDLHMANDNWVEIKPKRRQGPSMGKSQQGIPKDFNVGTTDNEFKGRAQGPPNMETHVNPAEVPDSVKGSKGPRQSRWDKSSDPADAIKGDNNFSKGHEPPLMNFIWQVLEAYCSLQISLGLFIEIFLYRFVFI